MTDRDTPVRLGQVVRIELRSRHRERSTRSLPSLGSSSLHPTPAGGCRGRRAPAASAGLPGAPHLLVRPAVRPPRLDEAVAGRRSGSGRSSMRSSISNPLARSRRIQSPWPRWNSTEGSSGHSKRCMPKWARRSSAVAGTSSSSGTHSMSSELLPRKISAAAGPQQPRRLRDPSVGVGPDGGAVLADGQVEAGIGAAAPPRPRPGSAGRQSRGRAWNSAAIASWPGGGVDATAARHDGPARPTRSRYRTPARPRRSRPGRAGSSPTSDSGIPNRPQVGSVWPPSPAVPSRTGRGGAGPRLRRSPRCSRSVPRPWRPP